MKQDKVSAQAFLEVDFELYGHFHEPEGRETVIVAAFGVDYP